MIRAVILPVIRTVTGPGSQLRPAVTVIVIPAGQLDKSVPGPRDVTITVSSPSQFSRGRFLPGIVRGANDIVRAMRDAPAGARRPVRVLFEHGREKWPFPDDGGRICRGRPGGRLAAFSGLSASLAVQDQL